VYGLPEVLVVDHAPHFVGADLRDACGQLGIHLDPCAGRLMYSRDGLMYVVARIH